MSAIDRVWFGADGMASLSRAALTPLELAFRAVSGLRGALYATGVLPTRVPAVPCVSVGNLSVGGTGKTPVSSWLARKLSISVPTAIILRGYGGDEAEVHRRLSPQVPVIALGDRLVAARTAKASGARVAVLDDAFQHRRIARVADVVLVSVEQVLRPRRLLPAGPWREPLSAASRADLVVLTRKSASTADVEAARAIIARECGPMKTAVVHLAPRELVLVNGSGSTPLDSLNGTQVLAISAIGEPDLFRRQLEAAGARVTQAAFRDHHAFSHLEASQLAARAAEGIAVCTLKDAVKLAALWPPSGALWYLSQVPEVEQGAEHIEGLCARVLEHATAAG